MGEDKKEESQREMSSLGTETRIGLLFAAAWLVCALVFQPWNGVEEERTVPALVQFFWSAGAAVEAPAREFLWKHFGEETQRPSAPLTPDTFMQLEHRHAEYNPLGGLVASLTAMAFIFCIPHALMWTARPLIRSKP